MSRSMPIECPARLGKYTLLRHLSAGGMADLYEARLMGIENFRRSIAIKVVRKPDGLSDREAEEFVTMFIDEARVCGQLTHANIAQVYELGKVDDLPYMAMELVEGHSLAQLARRARAEESPLPLAFVAYVVGQTAMGLDYAHRRTSLDGEALNIVHRDVSPDNVLVSYEGEVKVIDFGVAHARQRRRKTEDGGLRGKLPYMAPEQARQEEVDARADIFGLGAILFELVAGRRLYLSAGVELFMAARDGLLPDMDRTLGATAPELREVIERCLAVDREHRFASAAEVAKALEPFTINDRSIFGHDAAAQLVARFYPDQPNRRRAQPSSVPAAEAAAMQTQVLKTFDSEFYKRVTQAVEPIDPKVALGPAATQPAAPAPRGDDTVASTPALDRPPRSGKAPIPLNSPRAQRLAIGTAVILAVLVAGAVSSWWLGSTPEGGDRPVVGSARDRGFVTFASPVDGKVMISIDGRRWRKIPEEPLALPRGPHRIRFRYRPDKGKPRNATQNITVTERHTRDRPLRISFR